MNNNNFFNWAYKETTQDTFVAWLLNSFNDTQDSEEKEVAEKLLEEILNLKRKHIEKVKVTRQYKIQKYIIDVFVEIELDDKAKKYIIFEDKLFQKNNEKNGENGEKLQILEYVENVKEYLKTENVIGIYYKMIMTEMEKEEIKNKNANIKIIDANKIGKILNKEKYENTILNEYKIWINNINNAQNEIGENSKISIDSSYHLSLAQIYKIFDLINKKIENKEIKCEPRRFRKNDYLSINIGKRIFLYVVFDGTHGKLSMYLVYDFQKKMYKNKKELINNIINDNMEKELRNKGLDISSKGDINESTSEISLTSHKYYNEENIITEIVKDVNDIIKIFQLTSIP